MTQRTTLTHWRRSLTATLAAIAVHGTCAAADIDIYGGSGVGTVPNVLFFLDNSANWSGQLQAWFPDDSWAGSCFWHSHRWGQRQALATMRSA